MKRALCVIVAFILSLSAVGCGESQPVPSRGEASSADASVSSADAVSSEVSSEENASSEAAVSSKNETVSSTPAKAPNNNSPVTVSYDAKAVNGGKTFTGLPAKANIKYTLKDPNNTAGLSTTRNSFSFGAAKNGEPHSITVNNQKTFDGYDLGALAWDNKTQEKILYLTFDCGYEYKNLTSVMLDTLKEKNVKAAFFCTMDYLEDAPETVTRMINEGHIVGNHSTTHPDCTTISREALARELLGVHNYMRVNFGYDAKYFRFPSGVYSQSALDVVNSVGYRSAFWSIAHTDWDPANQPGVEKSFATVTQRLHPGAVILLHTTSPDNAEILGRFIDYACGEGYEFRTLDSYGYW